MKKYYLVAEKTYDGRFHVFVTDNAKGRIALLEVEANSFLEASKMFSFSVKGIGKTAFCGVTPSGKVYIGED